MAKRTFTNEEVARILINDEDISGLDSDGEVFSPETSDTDWGSGDDYDSLDGNISLVVNATRDDNVGVYNISLVVNATRNDNDGVDNVSLATNGENGDHEKDSSISVEKNPVAEESTDFSVSSTQSASDESDVEDVVLSRFQRAQAMVRGGIFCLFGGVVCGCSSKLPTCKDSPHVKPKHGRPKRAIEQPLTQMEDDEGYRWSNTPKDPEIFSFSEKPGLVLDMPVDATPAQFFSSFLVMIF